jgi:hypothetical protein
MGLLYYIVRCKKLNCEVSDYGKERELKGTRMKRYLSIIDMVVSQYN